MTVTLLVDSQNTLGESPCWDSVNKQLYWVDIMEKKILTWKQESKTVNEYALDQYAGCLSLTESGKLIMGLQHGIHYFDWPEGQLEKIVDPESHLEDNRFNDGKCDPAGRFWAGTTDTVGAGGKGALYVLDQTLQITRKIENVGTSNGLAWSPDARFMYFIDTPTRQVVRYDYNVHTGDIENPEIAVTFPEHAGLPDGMTIDQEGMLWIAHWGGKGVSRWDPDTGKQMEFIAVPAVNVTSCTFGGESGSTLFITSARTGMTAEQLKTYPHAGGVFTLETNTKGTDQNVFNDRHWRA
ncbi:SMP-30/gluconolactonase/LRE family protein [Bacillus sp. KH172YL63]|uniref:SMP-30/gluconolactonase/LRE family protein n=1 Tax=Bacillus sp. KH172YL63 TaxID=2709784 RepID=UPI0013E48B7B|nr:SMP-30/gluconolactonase/LRE family protein [Bacillus sp. KH172YL63]BCB03621.1 hypothetical protein KH172YL63_17540 [Bacillus sp. KH172YL63]